VKRFFLLLLEISVLRAGPQEVPASGFLLGLVLAVHFAVGIALELFSVALPRALWGALVGTLTTVVLLHLLLVIRRRPARLVQALTALAGCEALVGLIAVPLTAWVIAFGDAQFAPRLLSMLLLVWSIAFTGHIFRHALDLNRVVGVLLAIGYVLISSVIAGALTGSY